MSTEGTVTISIKEFDRFRQAEKTLDEIMQDPQKVHTFYSESYHGYFRVVNFENFKQAYNCDEVVLLRKLIERLEKENSNLTSKNVRLKVYSDKQEKPKKWWQIF